MNTECKRFPDFGRELRRSYAVHANCYDCAAFYEGCDGWQAAKEFNCAHYQQLPDVMPATCGQPWSEKVFVPADLHGDGESAEQRQEERPRPVQTMANHDSNDQEGNDVRQWDCGEALAKGRQYCDAYRVKRRRETMREYMRRRRAG